VVRYGALPTDLAPWVFGGTACGSTRLIQITLVGRVRNIDDYNGRR
jgi:hypothetical protein